MQISALTIEILKNFSAINPIFTFDGEGQVLRTQTPLKDLVAHCEIDEQLPEFHIYDLRSFLATVGLIGDSADFDFSSNAVKITSLTGKRKANYAFCSKDLVEAPKKSANIPPPDLVVEITKEQMTGILNAARTIGVGDIAFRTKGSDAVLLCAEAAKNDGNPNTFEIELEAQKSPGDGKSFSFKVENFRFVPATYTVSISLRGIAEFKTVLGNGKVLKYWTPVVVS
jgi:hypothetical protein